MSFRLKIIITLILLVLLTASPWLWQWNPWSIAVIAPILIGWYIWMVLVYLRWARSLSGRGRNLVD